MHEIVGIHCWCSEELTLSRSKTLDWHTSCDYTTLHYKKVWSRDSRKDHLAPTFPQRQHRHYHKTAERMQTQTKKFKNLPPDQLAIFKSQLIGLNVCIWEPIFPKKEEEKKTEETYNKWNQHKECTSLMVPSSSADTPSGSPRRAASVTPNRMDVNDTSQRASTVCRTSPVWSENS